jgi:hypothetical protein
MYFYIPRRVWEVTAVGPQPPISLIQGLPRYAESRFKVAGFNALKCMGCLVGDLEGLELVEGVVWKTRS